MGIFDFWRPRKASPPSNKPAQIGVAQAVPSPNPGITSIDVEHFVLELPFAWEAVPITAKHEYEFRNQNIPEQLIVSILLNRESLDLARRRSVVQKLTEVRLGAIAELAKGRAEHSVPQKYEGNDQCEMRCVSRDRTNGVQVAFVVRAAPEKVATVTITRYALPPDGNKSFDVYSGVIFDLFQLKRPGQTAGT